MKNKLYRGKGNRSAKKYEEESKKKIKVALGSDHAGFSLKEDLKEFLDALGVKYEDLGAYSRKPVDYPDIAIGVGEVVASGKYNRGILICGTGIGMSIVANKVPGIRASVCSNVVSATYARRHNDANVLTMGAWIVGLGLAQEIVSVWLATRFEGGEDHNRRVDKIKKQDRGEKF